jgi:hypothetical protein
MLGYLAFMSYLPADRFTVCSDIYVQWMPNLIRSTYFSEQLLPPSKEQSPSWEANWFVASQEIPRILLNQKVHYCIHNCSPPLFILSQPNPVLTPTSPTFWRSILILFSHVCLGTRLSLPLFALHARPSHSWFITHTILGEEYRSWSSSLWSFLHYPVTPSLLGPNIPLNTQFSNTLSLRSSLSVSDQVSHSYKTTDKIIALYIIIFRFLDSNLEHKRFCIEW